MKHFILFILIISACSCSGRKDNSEASAQNVAESTQISDSFDIQISTVPDSQIPYIDLSRDYPREKLDITDIADIRYIPLETTDESLLSSVTTYFIGNNRIVIPDIQSQQILIFDGDGKYLNKIARQGGGPQEYSQILKSCVDFENGLVYILDCSYPCKLIAYDYDGNMIKSFTLEGGTEIRQMFLLNTNTIIANCRPGIGIDEEAQADFQPYQLINTDNGEIRPVDLGFTASESATKTKNGENGVSRAISIPIYPMMKNGNEVIVSDYTHPLVYHGTGNNIKPLVQKNESKRHADGNIMLATVIGRSERYVIFYTVEKIDDGNNLGIGKQRKLIYDLTDGSIKEIDLKNPDTGKGMMIVGGLELPENTMGTVIPNVVIQRFREKGIPLQGKLKEIADTISPDANDVLMLITLK